MSKPYEPDFIKVTEIFLVPSSFLVAALGTADTNIHRACVSIIGLFVAVMWWMCSREALLESDLPENGSEKTRLSRRTKILAWLPVFFVGCWLASTIVHILLWNRPLGQGH